MVDAPRIAIVLHGESQVGKSALALRMVRNEFDNMLGDPTIESVYDVIIDVDGKPVRLSIEDPAGNEYRGPGSLSTPAFSMPTVFAFCINMPLSFQTVEENYDRYAARGEPVPPRILVATQCDRLGERLVSVEQGQALAARMNCQYFETSARTGQNVELAFLSLVREVLKDQGRGRPARRPCRVA